MIAENASTLTLLVRTLAERARNHVADAPGAFEDGGLVRRASLRAPRLDVADPADLADHQQLVGAGRAPGNLFEVSARDLGGVPLAGAERLQPNEHPLTSLAHGQRTEACDFHSHVLQRQHVPTPRRHMVPRIVARAALFLGTAALPTTF